jgi:hypothetical protein
MKAIVRSGSRAGRAARTIGGGVLVLVLSVGGCPSSSRTPADTLPTRTQCNRPDRVLARAAGAFRLSVSW